MLFVVIRTNVTCDRGRSYNSHMCMLRFTRGRDRYLKQVINVISIHVYAIGGSWVQVNEIVAINRGELSAISKVGE